MFTRSCPYHPLTTVSPHIPSASRLDPYASIPITHARPLPPHRIPPLSHTSRAWSLLRTGFHAGRDELAGKDGRPYVVGHGSPLQTWRPRASFSVCLCGALGVDVTLCLCSRLFLSVCLSVSVPSPFSESLCLALSVCGFSYQTSLSIAFSLCLCL